MSGWTWKTSICFVVVRVWSIRYNHFHDQLVLTSSSDSRVILNNVASISSEPYGHLVEDDEVDDEDKLTKNKYVVLFILCWRHLMFTYSPYVDIFTLYWHIHLLVTLSSHCLVFLCFLLFLSYSLFSPSLLFPPLVLFSRFLPFLLYSSHLSFCAHILTCLSHLTSWCLPHLSLSILFSPVILFRHVYIFHI